jgi:hypothetical protein
MRHAFCMSLEARDATLGRFRAYRVEACPDLFGVWLVEVTYGRIGTRGRQHRYVAGDEAGARKLIRQTLRRRATAKQRIGVSYRICEVIDPGQWVQLQKGTELVSATLNSE